LGAALNHAAVEFPRFALLCQKKKKNKGEGTIKE
jgi:hypothetical protein